MPVTGSTAYVTGDRLVVSRRDAIGGGVPCRIHRSRCEIEARATKVAGPLLIPDSQTNPGDGALTGFSIESNQSATDSLLPGVDRSLRQAVEVEVRGAGDFVQPVLERAVAVGLTRRDPTHIRLRLEHDHRHVEVVPDQGR